MEIQKNVGVNVFIFFVSITFNFFQVVNSAKRYSKEVDLTFCHLRRYEHLLKSKIFSVNNNAIKTTECFVNSLQVISLYEFEDNNDNKKMDSKQQMVSKFKQYFPANMYLFKVNKRNTRKSCKMCQELTIKTSLTSLWCFYY